METETAFNSLPFTTQTQPKLYRLQIAIDLQKIILPETPLDLAITAVIEDKDARISYWALNHRSTQADFHQRDSFSIDL